MFSSACVILQCMIDISFFEDIFWQAPMRLSSIEPCHWGLQVSAGGSLSNTLLALARLGAAEHALHGRGTLRVAMDGIIGGDPLSEFYHSQMQRAGVKVLARPSPASCTGVRPNFPFGPSAQR